MQKQTDEELPPSAPGPLTISINEYEANHGAKPRGRGSWAFIFAASARQLRERQEAHDYLAYAWFVPGPARLYGDALKLAKAEARRRGERWIGVCS